MTKFLYKHKETIIIALVLIAILCILFKDVVFSDYVFTKRDIARLYYPVRNFVVETFKSGEIPLWNPYIFCGMPLHATIHHAVFYPPTIIYYFGEMVKGLSLFILFHIFLCGFFTYLLMRYLSVSRAGAFLSGFTFMLSGYIISTICLATALCSIAWFPLVLLLFIKARRGKDIRISCWLGVVLTLMFLGGDPPAFIAVFSFLFLTSVYLVVESYVRYRRIDKFVIFNLLTASFIFFMLSAFQTFPAIEYYSQSVRTNIGWKEASSWSMPFSHLLSLIIPYVNEPALFGNDLLAGQKWLDNYYVGIITLILAGFGIFFGRKRRIVQFFIGIAALSIALSLGKNFILYPALYKFLPFFRILRYPVRFFFIFTFSICVLCGIGFDYIRKLLLSEKLKKIGRAFLVAGFISSFLVILIMLIPKEIISFVMKKAGDVFFSEDMFVYANLFNLRRALMYIGFFGIFLFLASRTRYKRIALIPVFSLVIMDILFTNIGYEQTERIDYFKEPTPNIEFLMQDKSIFRILQSPYAYHRTAAIRGETLHEGLRTSKDFLLNNRMMEFGISDVWGYDSSSLKSNRKLLTAAYSYPKPSDTNILNLLNAKYIVSHDNMSAFGYSKVNRAGRATIYKNERWLPRAMVLRKQIVINDGEKMLEYMSSKRFNPQKKILLEEEVDLSGPSIKKGFLRKERADVVLYKPREVEIEVFLKKPALLFLSDTYYPGWHAYVDEERVKIYRADYFLRAVRVPAGEHSVRFVYNPISLKIGTAITLTGLLFLSIIITRNNRRRKQ